MKLTDHLVEGVVIGAILFIGIGAGYVAIHSESTEQVECLKWQRQAQQYPGFYLTEWQAQQCDHYKISINAPIK